jgi:hypothetical protein
VKHPRVLLPFVAVLLVAGVVTAVSVSGDPAPSPGVSEGRLEIQGAAVVGHGGTDRTVHTLRDLTTGDTVALTSGAARVDLPSGGYVELRQDSRVTLDHGPELMAGSLLVVPNGAPVTVESLGTLVRGAAGATRLTVNLGVQVDVLAGAADITSAGRELEVPALRSAHVPAVGLVPGQPVPLVVTADDPWDQRYLAAVIDSGAALENLSRAFTGQVGRGDVQSVAFYQSLLPGLAAESEFDQSSVDGGRPPGETLLAAAIALRGRRGDSFHARFADGLGFRAEGATWGLVAEDQLVPSLPDLVNLVSGAVGQSPQQAASVPVAPQNGGAVAQPSARPTTAPTVAPRSSALRPPVTTLPTTVPGGPAVPGSTAPTAPLNGLLAPVLDPVLNLLNGLLAPVLGAPTPPPAGG